MDASDVEYRADALPDGDDDEAGTTCPTIARVKNQSSRNDSTTQCYTQTLSTVERLKPSITSLISYTTAATPAPDHFTALPEDASSSTCSESRHRQQQRLTSNTPTARLNAPKHHTSPPTSRTSSSLCTVLFGDDRPAVWSTENLLEPRGSRTMHEVGGKSGLRTRFAIPGVLAVGAGDGNISDGSYHCPYTAMRGGPIESPATTHQRGDARGREDREGAMTPFAPHPAHGQGNGHSGSSFGSAPSSRATLVGRLGSALKSLTRGATDEFRGRVGSNGASGEGRPGPFGTKYTQQTAGYSLFEPSQSQQVRKRLQVDSALITAAAVSISDGRGGKDGDEETTERSATVPSTHYRSLSDGVAESRSDETATQGNSDSSSSISHPYEMDASLTASAKDTQGGGIGEANGERWTRGVEGGDIRETRDRRESGAEAGAGTETTQIVSTFEKGANTASSGPLETRVSASDGRAAGEKDEKDGKSPGKKAGLWELKAERSRLEQALFEAEAERDWERMRADETEARLAEARSRLEALRSNGRVVASVEV